MKKLVAALSAFAFAGSALAFMPQAGIWSISPERNGQPGRGFNLDVQNSTLVMQMYGYEKSGAPTFYLSAGQIADNTYSGQLFQYAGGRYMGGPAQSAHETGSAGTVKMRFVSGIKGYITFPGEEEKEIVRYTFAYEETPQSLLGRWAMLAGNTSTGAYTATFGDLDRISGQTVYSANETMACRYTGATTGEVACVQSLTGQIILAARFLLSVNDGDGHAGVDVNSIIHPFTARRLINSVGTGTGISVKSSPALPSEATRLLDDALDAISQASNPSD